MQSIASSEGLKIAIQLAEVEQANHLQQLKEQFRRASESLRPANVFRSTLNNMAASPNLPDTILSTALGLATGFLTRKLVVSASGTIFSKLVGSVLQLGVTNTVARHPATVKSLAQFIFQKIHRRKERNTEEL